MYMNTTIWPAPETKLELVENNTLLPPCTQAAASPGSFTGRVHHNAHSTVFIWNHQKVYIIGICLTYASLKTIFFICLAYA